MLKKFKFQEKNPASNSPLYFIVDLNENSIGLKNGDKITVPKRLILKEVESVIVTGEINIPGIYPLNDITSIQTIIDFAGGITDNALNNGIEIFRDSLIVGWNNLDFPLLNGDSLHVLKKTGSVRVLGEVNSRGYYSYKKGDSIKDYLRRAGGFSSFADPKDIFITYPNGNSQTLSGFISPKVLEGSTITVNSRKISGSPRGPNRWEALRIIAGQAGNIATTLLSLILISNQINGS